MIVSMWSDAGKALEGFGALFGGLSIASLAVLTFDVGVSTSFTVLFSYYDHALQALLGWAEPALQRVLSFVGSWIGIELQIDPYWRHVFVLLGLYVSADVRANLALRRFGFAAFSGVLGGGLALVGSVAAASGPTTPDQLDLVAAGVPMAAVVLFELGRATGSSLMRVPTPSGRSGNQRGEIFNYLFWRFPVAIGFIAAAALICVSLLDRRFGLSGVNLSLLALFTFIILLTTHFLVRAAQNALSGQDAAEVGARFSRSGSGRVGRLMLATLVGGAAFVALNAGLNHIGL